ncbi:sugar O-acetyltransferase [Niabella yanshanensis]|uniref:Acetyltransferase n=1 Tax=Niabella yanshanensis TaxID=577386 RepID=A0ABZ0W4F7_9BACT|nr:sugar O-acetyltransferase [Niabella yanshanensis]WQD37513.1 sugar O-acetyltransferase [Niabella yanshanensis]
MNEKEKMLAGKPYKSFEPQLFEERQRAKDLNYQINQLHPFKLEERNELFKKLLGSTGTQFHIEPPFYCDYGYNITIGENFYSNYNCIILDCAPVTIGDNVLLAPNVAIYTAGHPIHYEPRNEAYEYAFPVTIGNNVWIGGNTVINPGITIGDNTVIGSGSVVTKDIPANVIAVGSPCKLIRSITDEDQQYYFRNLKF